MNKAELRAKGRKKCWSPSQRFWLEVSLYLTTPFVNSPITPNMITIAWIILEFIAAYLFAQGNYLVNIIAVILFNFIVLLGDHLDGNLARMKEQFSLLGPYLEQMGLFFGTPLIFLGLAIGNYSRFHNLLFLFIGIAGVFFWLYEKLIRINPVWFGEDKINLIRKVYGQASFGSSPILAILVEPFRRGQPFNLLFFLIIFDYTQAASLLYSAFFALEFCRKFASTILNINKIPKSA